jgi:hypothetical protein
VPKPTHPRADKKSLHCRSRRAHTFLGRSIHPQSDPRTALLHLGKQFRKRITDGRRLQILLRLGFRPACAQTGIDMKLELQAEAGFRSLQSQGGQQHQQRLDRGVFSLVLMRAQVIAAGTGFRQAHQPAPRRHLRRHPGRLAPAPVEQQHLQMPRWRPGRQWLAAWMQDPKFAIRGDDCRPVGRRFPSEKMSPRGGHHAVDQTSGTGGTIELAMVNKHVHLQRTSHRLPAGANAPAGGEATAGTPRGAGQNYTSGHDGEQALTTDRGQPSPAGHRATARLTAKTASTPCRRLPRLNSKDLFRRLPPGFSPAGWVNRITFAALPYIHAHASYPRLSAYRIHSI